MENVVSADEVQARLALRALFRPRPNCCSRNGDAHNGTSGENGSDVEDEATAMSSSTLYRSIRADVNDVLKSGLSRRLERLEKKVGQLVQPINTSTAGSAAVAVQTEPAHGHDEDHSSGARPAEVVSKVLGASHTPTSRLMFGPSKSQEQLADPPEKREDVVKETTTLRSTLQNLRQSISSREKQIDSLSAQLVDCEKLYGTSSGGADATGVCHRLLLADPDNLGQVHGERIRRRQTRIAELEAALEDARGQAKYYHSLSQQQRAFFLQSERVAVSGGTESLNRHRAGAVFLVDQPVSLGDDSVKAWDVGNAIANPYIVDSWPFEPNVLARRAPQESTMAPLTEETPEDLEEGPKRGLRNPFRPGLNLRLPMPGRDGDDDEDYDDRYLGPSDTARSL